MTDKIACDADLGFAEEEVVGYCCEQVVQVHSFTSYCNENCKCNIPHLHTDGEDAVRGNVMAWEGKACLDDR